jgi:DNA polymerase alpha/epsilon subunit B
VRPVCAARAAGGDSPAQAFCLLCGTLLQQSHLCPLPLDSQAVYWQYDVALRLYPLPDLLVVADSVPAADTLFGGCQCINPVRCCLLQCAVSTATAWAAVPMLNRHIIIEWMP